MGVNDRYDRTGQYSGGDTGRKVEGFAHGRDRRDYAAATMVGDGGWDNRQGYGAILDSIENRIAAVSRFNGRGEYGYYGKGLGDSYTLQDIVTARTPGGGFQFSNWSPRNREAYAITQRALAGQPRGLTEQDWYDQALGVYDDYYANPLSGLRGVAQGATYYQNAAALTPSLSAFQRDMQQEYGALPVGIAGHVMTGPGLTAYGRQAYDPAQNWDFEGLPADLSLDFGTEAQPFADGYGSNTIGATFGDDLGGVAFDFAGSADPMGPEAYGPATAQIAPDTYGVDYGTGYAAPTEAFTGTDSAGFVGSDWGDDLGDYAAYSGAADPMQGDAYGYAAPTEAMAGTADVPSFGGSYEDDLGDYAEYAGPQDPMGPEAYGPGAATWGGDPMASAQYGPATAPASAGPMQPDAYAKTGALPSLAARQQPFAAPTPQNRLTEQRTPVSWGAPQQQPQRQAVSMGVVGGTGQGTETQRRADGTISDRAGGYGGKDAFGPGDPFGGMGFSRSSYGGYADVIDRYNRATGGITRSVYDRSGRLVDQRTAGGWDGSPTGERSDGGASRGDGSYSESSGRNDNNPQGIY